MDLAPGCLGKVRGLVSSSASDRPAERGTGVARHDRNFGLNSPTDRPAAPAQRGPRGRFPGSAELSAEWTGRGGVSGPALPAPSAPAAVPSLARSMWASVVPMADRGEWVAMRPAESVPPGPEAPMVWVRAGTAGELADLMKAADAQLPHERSRLDGAPSRASAQLISTRCRNCRIAWPKAVGFGR